MHASQNILNTLWKRNFISPQSLTAFELATIDLLATYALTH
jgi:hypothetical protein